MTSKSQLHSLTIIEAIPKDGVIRCFKMIDRKNDARYGRKCNKILMQVNDKDQAAGKIICRYCHATYNIVNNKIHLIR